MFFYLPLESYRERYTYLMSSENGWMEQRFKELGVDFYRVSGKTLSNTKFVETGIVLDYFGRAYYSLLQNAEVVRLIKEGVIKDGDILYYEDFWTPGMEAVQYAAELAGIKLDIYAMLHAQTVDKYDFTVKLKKWMRHYEIGQSKFMKGIFVSSEYLQDLCTEAGLDNVFKVGLPYNKDFILQNFLNESIKKKNQVIFSSRFDEEKNPLFFVEFAKYCKQQGEDFEFIFTSSAKEFKSNSEYIKRKMIEAEKEGIIKIKTNLTKKEYYIETTKICHKLIDNEELDEKFKINIKEYNTNTNKDG